MNVLSLILSAPFVGCSEGEGEEAEGGRRCDDLFVWFVVITCVDFLLSVVYTLQVIARIEYTIYLHVHKNRVSQYTYICISHSDFAAQEG